MSDQSYSGPMPEVSPLAKNASDKLVRVVETQLLAILNLNNADYIQTLRLTIWELIQLVEALEAEQTADSDRSVE